MGFGVLVHLLTFNLEVRGLNPVGRDIKKMAEQVGVRVDSHSTSRAC